MFNIVLVQPEIPPNTGNVIRLAANQGLYNGFLVAGLVWGLSQGAAGQPVTLFFLGCVIVAGVFGALTVNHKILFVQAVPAAAAMAAVLLA